MAESTGANQPRVAIEKPVSTSLAAILRIHRPSILNSAEWHL